MMDRSEVITLVNETQVKNDFGVYEPVSETRDVFCQVRSITRSEFFDAGRNGLNPEFEFDVFFGDYEGERTVIYKGQQYAVYRTYQARTDVLELYVQREGGTNGTVNS
jgi:SPP1 family predicted phage head-tail adaptor